MKSLTEGGTQTADHQLAGETQTANKTQVGNGVSGGHKLDDDDEVQQISCDGDGCDVMVWCHSFFRPMYIMCPLVKQYIANCSAKQESIMYPKN